METNTKPHPLLVKCAIKKALARSTKEELIKAYPKYKEDIENYG